jgi:hypothetical protein
VPPRRRTVTPVQADPADDPELAAYNKHLAELDARHRARSGEG